VILTINILYATLQHSPVHSVLTVLIKTDLYLCNTWHQSVSLLLCTQFITSSVKIQTL